MLPFKRSLDRIHYQYRETVSDKRNSVTAGQVMWQAAQLLQFLPPQGSLVEISARVVKASGFSLHARVAAEACERQGMQGKGLAALLRTDRDAVGDLTAEHLLQAGLTSWLQGEVAAVHVAYQQTHWRSR